MVEIRVRFPEHYIYLLFPCVLFDMFLFEGWRDQNVIVLVAPFPLKLKRVNIQKWTTMDTIKNYSIIKTKRNMQKELLEIEFRYHDRPIGSCPATSCSKTIAIGIFDTLEEAVKAGNETLKVLSEHFQVRSDDRFKVRGLFGTPDRLVTNCCYTTKGIAYFAKITPLKFDDLSETIAETFKHTIDTDNIDVNKKR